ncbi:M67 family metallopeptidase [Polymorphobacter sp.]|uniref:M67 family metallopeptidase n=1 Tax=Polymorphobacter sp. TaxID=1909290 RepID=UPI003F725B42
MIVRIASGLYQQLIDAAAADARREVCGLILGRPDQILAVRPAPNVAENPEQRFEIDPAVLLAVHRQARGEGLKVIGHYHSHPGGDARPSLRDAARAVEDGQLWVIVAGASVTAWRSVAQGSAGALHGRFSIIHLEVQ